MKKVKIDVVVTAAPTIPKSSPKISSTPIIDITVSIQVVPREVFDNQMAVRLKVSPETRAVSERLGLWQYCPNMRHCILKSGFTCK
jgi:hypothetical protein